MIKPSTFSIVAYDSDTESWGIAVASKFLAVGAVVPWLSSNAGAIATQSYANTLFGMDGIKLLASGISAEKCFQEISKSDQELDLRQVGIVDKFGGSFTFTGKQCHDWAGGISQPGYAIQGNLLASQSVILEMERYYLASKGDFADRLFAALKAGDAAGGDKRGRQSAALRIVKAGGGYGGFSDNLIDFRVDNESDPFSKLLEMMELRHLYYDRSPVEEKIPIDEKVIKQFAPMLIRKGHLCSENFNENEFLQALSDFIGYENFEDRFDPINRTLDKPVHDYIIRRY